MDAVKKEKKAQPRNSQKKNNEENNAMNWRKIENNEIKIEEATRLQSIHFDIRFFFTI